MGKPFEPSGPPVLMGDPPPVPVRMVAEVRPQPQTTPQGTPHYLHGSRVALPPPPLPTHLLVVVHGPR